MRPCSAVLLTPLECAVPGRIPISIQSAPGNPLESALTSHSQTVENTATLSLLECALTRLSPATPLESALTKNRAGGREPLLVPELATHHVSLATILKFFLFTLLRTLLRSFARSQESSPFFSIDSALFCQKPPGGGAAIPRALRASRRGRGASAKPAFLSSSGTPPSNAAQSQVTVTFFACFNFPLSIEDLGLVGTVNLFSNLLHLPPQAGVLEFQ